VLATLALAARPAHAERRPMIAGQLGVGAGAADQLVDAPDDVRTATLVLTWEQRPLPYPSTRGYVVTATVVPELQVRGVSVDRETDVDRFWAASIGLRAELRGVARRPFGLGLGARGGAYVATRLGFFDNGEATRLYGLGLGSYVWLGARLRVGVELDASRYGRPDAPSFIARPFVIGDGQSAYTTITGGLSVGVSL
jgi:hypothetical protein